jgi:hypothetical protein
MTSKTKTSSTTLKQCSLRLGKPKLKLQQAKAKQLLRCRVLAAGSSRRVQEAVDEVVSLPAALL